MAESNKKFKFKFNKEGVLALVCMAVIAIVLIVLIVFIVKAVSQTPPDDTSEVTTTADTVNTDQTTDTSTTPTTDTTATTTTETDATTEPTTQTETDATTETTEATTTEETSIIPIEGTMTFTLPHDDIYKGDLIIVNESNAYRAPSAETSTLVSLYKKTGFGYSYRLRNTRLALQGHVVENFGAMLNAMKETFASSSLKDDYLLINFAAIVNDPGAAVDYTNENASGLSFDIRVYITSTQKTRILNSTEQKWLADNCAAYGFILRYPEDKSSATGVSANLYHFRYVGTPHSLYMKNNNLCLEDYIALIKEGTFESPLVVSTGAATYNIYYVYASEGTTEIKVPNASPYYSISGDNSEGFIVMYQR